MLNEWSLPSINGNKTEMTKVYTGLRVTKKGEEGDCSIFPVFFVPFFSAYGQSFKSEGLSFLPTGKNV